MLSVADKPIMLSVIMLNAIMPNVIMLIVIMQNVIMLSVVESTTHQFFVTYEWAEKGSVTLHKTRKTCQGQNTPVYFAQPYIMMKVKCCECYSMDRIHNT